MWNIFLLKLLRNKWIFCLDDFKYGSINFHIQEKQPPKHENLAIVPFKTLSIISPGKAFWGQKIPQSRCARKETADRGIIKTSKNGDRKIMQPVRIKSGSPTQIRK